MSNEINVRKNIEDFMSGRGRDKRYASFDYCYNYFQDHYRNNELKKMADDDHIQLSCLQLGFYLASWGMLRGSSFLLEKSVGYYRNLINYISTVNENIWKIDVNNYNDDSCLDRLLECKDRIKEVFGGSGSEILITKVMLGVFGNIPAFDTYFKQGFRVGRVNKDVLKKIYEFYLLNKEEIDNIKIFTFNFHDGKDKYLYTKAKLIDMIGFVEGMKNKKSS